LKTKQKIALVPKQCHLRQRVQTEEERDMWVPSVRGHLSDRGHGESMGGHACLSASLCAMRCFGICFLSYPQWAIGHAHLVTELFLDDHLLLYHSALVNQGSHKAAGGDSAPPGMELCSPHGLLEAQPGAPIRSQFCSPATSSSFTLTLLFFLTRTRISALFILSSPRLIFT